MWYNIENIYYICILSVLFITSCQFGLFNTEYPDKSSFSIYIDNEQRDEYAENMTFSFSLDDENFQNKFMKIEGKHKKKDKK